MPSSRLDDLRKAYEATTKGKRKVNGRFTALAHAAMPDLLASVDHLEKIVAKARERRLVWIELERAKRTLANLKRKDQ